MTKFGQIHIRINPVVSYQNCLKVILASSKNLMKSTQIRMKVRLSLESYLNPFTLLIQSEFYQILVNILFESYLSPTPTPRASNGAHERLVTPKSIFCCPRRPKPTAPNRQALLGHGDGPTVSGRNRQGNAHSNLTTLPTRRGQIYANRKNHQSDLKRNMSYSSMLT